MTYSPFHTMKAFPATQGPKIAGPFFSPDQGHAEARACGQGEAKIPLRSSSDRKLLVLLRHGQSAWNLENRFTGWVDVDLSEEGYQQCHDAGQRIKASGIQFDILFTSVLKRAIKTGHLVLEEADQLWIPEVKSWRLNERHYGALQGLNKKDTAEKYGDEKVHIWRRSYDTLPPTMADDAEFSAVHDPRYANLPQDIIPRAENLKITLDRVLPFWEDHIAPALLDNKTVLIAAHGNSLRALAKHIEQISDEDIMNLEIATGTPLLYELDGNLQFIAKQYL